MELLEDIDSCELERHGGTYFNYVGKKTGYTALMFAMKRGLMGPVRKMIDHLERCNINAKNHHGLTITFWARCCKDEDIRIKIFNALPKTQTNVNSMMLFCSDSPKLADVIIDTVVNDSAGELTMSTLNWSKRTLLMDMITNGHSDIVMKMLQYPEKCGLRSVNGYGNTALMIACYRSKEDIALELLKNYRLCNLRAKNMKGLTALDVMKSNELKDAMEIVMKNADIDDVIFMTDAQKDFLLNYIADRYNST